MVGHTCTSGLAQYQQVAFSIFTFSKSSTCYLKHPGRDVQLNDALPPFCGTLANSADPDQTPHNQGGVGSGSPLLFARNLNKKHHQKQHYPKSGYELVQNIKMGNSIRHVWVTIKCENE